MVSWIVAVLFAPLLGLALLSKPVGNPSTKPGAVLGHFRKFLASAMRARWITIGVTLACFVAAVLASPLVPREFFPPSDRPELLVDLSLPQNASIYATEDVAEGLDSALKGDPDVDRWSTYIGRGAPRFYLPLNVELANNFFTQAVVVAKDVAARERIHKKLEAALAERFPSAVSRVSPLGLGPPIFMMLSSCENAVTWRVRSGVFPISGNSAEARCSEVHCSCNSSGTIFSPSTRFARITEGTRIRRRAIQAGCR